MSQFDYPRINFYGRATASPCTANNVNDTPLIYYDPVQVTAVLPPRIFLTGATYQSPYTLQDVEAALPPGAVQRDGENRYFCIDPIKDKAAFDEWVITPLGECPLDAAYHPVYDMILAPVRTTGGTLKGAIPGYWNYFGDESFQFQEVRVVSVALPAEQGEAVYEAPEDGLPDGLAALLGAELAMDRAFMVDITPSTSSFTQIFCQNMALQKDGTSFFSGVPLKGNLRTVNMGRIVNQQMPESGSGDIFTAIPIEQLEGKKKSPLIRLFRKYGRSKRKLKGIFVRYNLFENEEIRPFDYRSRGKNANPAKLAVAGSISPWYEGEMRSFGLGRQLVYHQVLAGATMLPPVMTRLDYRRRRFQVDLFNSLPEAFVPPGHYDTYGLGKVEFRLLPDDGREPVVLGRLEIGPDHFNRAENVRRSGIVTFPLELTKKEGRAGSLAVYLVNDAGHAAQIMREEEYTLFTDQAALYGEAGDDPLHGYHSYGGRREPCRLRVHYRGRPVRDPAPFTLVEFRVVEAGAQVTAHIFRHARYRDKDIVSFPTHAAANAIYLFLPGHTWQVPREKFAAIFLTGYAVHVRILPRHDYGRYLDPQHPDYPTPVTFDVLYREVFEAFDLAYPAMGRIIPFTSQAYDNPAMAQKLVELTSLENWGDYAYMPVTRDLSQDQRALIRKWAEGVVVRDGQ